MGYIDLSGPITRIQTVFGVDSFHWQESKGVCTRYCTPRVPILLAVDGRSSYDFLGRHQFLLRDFGPTFLLRCRPKGRNENLYADRPVNRLVPLLARENHFPINASTEDRN